MRSIISLVSLLCVTPLWAQTGSVTGIVADAESGNPLPGANVLVAGTSQGVATDVEGRYTITGLVPGTRRMLVSFAGYRNAERSATIVAGKTVQVDVVLQPGVELNPVQATAGRQQEKVFGAPASITVLTARDIEVEAPQTAVTALRNVAGLDIAQTGIDHHEVVLRGFNNVSSGATHILTDYRQASQAVTGVNVHSIMPSLPIDIERVEVVRGPGSALYGAGVDAGIIHYITKDAFYPGLTVAVGGGERSLLNFQGRIAGTVGGKLGLKLTGIYGRANDFALEACEEEFLLKVWFLCHNEPDAQIVRDNKFSKAGLNGYAEYRFSDNTALRFNAGFGSVNTTVLSNIGTILGTYYRSMFGQIRFNSGPFFAQAYLNKNNSGDSYFAYNGSPVTELSTQASIQAQYNLNIGGERERLVMGVDLEFQRLGSGGTIYGRNEEKGNIGEYGAYAQSTTQINRKLDLVAALRADYQSIFARVQFSPRAGLVFKPSPTNSVRATYNRSFANLSATSLFLDFVAAEWPIGPDTYLNLRVHGALGKYTWNRNPDYLNFGAPTDLVATSLLPGMEGEDTPVGIFTDLAYDLMYDDLAAIPNEDLADLLVESLELDPALTPLLVSQMDLIKALLHPSEIAVQGFSAGQMISFINSNNEVAPLPVVRKRPQISETFELGYKGIFGDRVRYTVDIYYAMKEIFVRGAWELRTPLVLCDDTGGRPHTALGSRN